MSVFNVFFDTPATRPFQSYRSQLDLKRVRVASQGSRATISIGDVTIGPFTGELRLTLYRGASLVHLETVVHTQEDRRAILYDTGLALPSASKTRFAWVDTEGKLERTEASRDDTDRHLAVRHRTLIAETASGSVACFPPPHQFFFPRDLTDNLKTVWYGRDHRGLDARFGFGIRQAERGGGSYVPWFNAPPGTDQRLGVFYLLSDGKAEEALAQDLRYTHGDRFPKLPGYHTFTSHWHMATAMAALAEKAREAADDARLRPHVQRHGRGDRASRRVPRRRPPPGSRPGPPTRDGGDVRGVQASLRRRDPVPSRRRGQYRPGPGPAGQGGRPLALSLSQARLLDHETRTRPAVRGRTIRRSGRSITWETATTWSNCSSAKEAWPGRRTPGSRARAGLPTSSGTSRSTSRTSGWGPRGRPCRPTSRSTSSASGALDLLDDMANWGQKKYLPGEVDVFKIDHTHELYGHMNINYIRLEPDRLPRFDEGWQPVLDSLRAGRFFVTTGEVLIPEFTVNGQPSGSSVVVKPGEPVEVRFRTERDVSAPVRRADLGRRCPRLSRPDRPGRHGPVRERDADPQARPDRPQVGTPRGLGHRHRRRLHPAGLAVGRLNNKSVYSRASQAPGDQCVHLGCSPVSGPLGGAQHPPLAIDQNGSR